METESPPTPELDPARHATRRLAEALRSLVADVVDHDLTEAQALELLAGVEALAATAAGPHRPRYYETAALEQARAAFVDFSPISGRSHPLAIPMETEWVPGPDGGLGVRARLRIGMAHEGPPHGVHGGVVAAVFDELLGHAQQAHQVRALTATLTVRYRAVTPVDEDLEMFAQVVHASGRRWAGRATCMAGDTLTAEAEALFVGVDLDAIAAR
jgi:acyl-coenzyme A thioesterase PaaI-like protein